MDIKRQIEAMSVASDATIRQGLQAIDAGGLGIALLRDPLSRRFHGLVSDGDLRRALLGGLGLEVALASVSRPVPVTARVGTPIGVISASFSDAIRVIPLLDVDDRVVDLAILERRLHLPVAAPQLGERELQYVSECVLSGWISSAGPFVARFEEMFAAFCGTKHAVATSSGTTALHLALLALGIGPGDEVIVPSLTFVATANAVTYTGATPVIVDSEPRTWNIDPDAVRAAINKRTRAVIPVHLFGHAADMDQILDIATKNNLAVIEDVAQAHGAHHRDRRLGSLGDAAAFSFYGNKIVTTGEGGMVTTNRDDLAQKLRILRAHGMTTQHRYWHSVVGYNYRLTNLQAAVGVAQMERIEAILSDRRRIATAYDEALSEVPGIVRRPSAPWARSVCWLYSVLVDPNHAGRTRDDLIEALQRIGIETRPMFPPLHTQPIYQKGLSLPVAERLASCGLSLPSGAGLRLQEIRRVVDAVSDLIAVRQ